MESVRRPDKGRLRLWVAALRSGQYRQAKGALVKRVDGAISYCCLGVACEVAIANGLKVEVAERETEGGLGPARSYDYEHTLLPGSVRKFYGLEDSDPYLPLDPTDEDSSVNLASSLNDDHDFSFEEIAEVIEYAFDLKEETDGE